MTSAGTLSVTWTAQQSSQKCSRSGNVRSVANCSGFRNAPASPTLPKSITSRSRLPLQNEQTGSSEPRVSIDFLIRYY